MLTCICFSFLSCNNWFIDYPEVKRIGCSHIKYDRGIYIVELDSVKYAPSSIYANHTAWRAGRVTMPPVDGIQVTAFTLDGCNKVEFIAGDLDEKYLEYYFRDDYTPMIALISGMSILAIIAIISYYYEVIAKRKKRNLTKNKTEV